MGSGRVLRHQDARAELAAGIYTVNLTAGKTVYTERLVIAR